MMYDSAVDLLNSSHFIPGQHAQPEFPILAADDQRIGGESVLSVDLAMNKVPGTSHEISPGNGLYLILQIGKPGPVNNLAVGVNDLRKIVKTLAVGMRGDVVGCVLQIRRV